MLRSSDLNQDRKRHDQAVQQLQVAQAKCSRERTKRLHWISEDIRRQGHESKPFGMSTTQCTNTRRSSEQNLTPWDLRQNCQSSTCRAVSKRDREIAFVLLGMAASGLVSQKLAKLLKKYMLLIGQHRLSTTCIFYWTDHPPACCEATQHSTTGTTPGSLASASWRVIRLLEYLNGAR